MGLWAFCCYYSVGLISNGLISHGFLGMWNFVVLILRFGTNKLLGR